jgi:hypothetical protein
MKALQPEARAGEGGLSPKTRGGLDSNLDIYFRRRRDDW